jgi:mono/diheme cytochrome c family protein
MKTVAIWCLPILFAGGSSAWAQAQPASSATEKPAAPAAASKEAARQIRRGARLATFGGCHDCHTPKILTPHGPELDKSRLLSGFPAKSPLPPLPPGVIGPDKWGAVASNDLTAWVGPWGTSFAANLTPDVTGIGAWAEEQFIQTIRTGKHFGVGRAVLPPMPWFDVAALTDEELKALFAYLKSLKPVSNPVPQPLPPK